jgi:hypothetical protein
MTREEITRMAREAGIVVTGESVWTLCELVADAEATRMLDEGMVTVGNMRQQIAAEREACAKVCEGITSTYHENDPRKCADAIRARGQT